MKKITLLILLSSFLSGCIFFRPHKIDIEQGNIITEREILKVHPGMTLAKVRETLGTPLIINIFTPNREDYVYTYQAGYQTMQEKRVICIFQQGILKEIITQ